MQPDNNQSHIRIHKKTAFLLTAILLLSGAVLAGWLLGRSDNSKSADTSSNQSQNQSDDTNAPTGKNTVSELVSYTMPDGWETHTCEGSNATFVIPSGAMASCAANPVAPVKLSVDTGNHTDCNQLQNQREVKKHTCISLFINGKKTLKSSTEFLASSSYSKETTVDAYYFDSGSGVVLAEYIHSNDTKYHASFDQLVNSFSAK